MAALLIGVLFILFSIYSVLPVEWGLQWWPYVLDFIKGSLPVFILFIGAIAVLIGIADIRDRIEEKREEREEEKNGEAAGEKGGEEK